MCIYILHIWMIICLNQRWFDSEPNHREMFDGRVANRPGWVSKLFIYGSIRLCCLGERTRAARAFLGLDRPPEFLPIGPLIGACLTPKNFEEPYAVWYTQYQYLSISDLLCHSIRRLLSTLRRPTCLRAFLGNRIDANENPQVWQSCCRRSLFLAKLRLMKSCIKWPALPLWHAWQSVLQGLPTSFLTINDRQLSTNASGISTRICAPRCTSIHMRGHILIRISIYIHIYI